MLNQSTMPLNCLNLCTWRMVELESMVILLVKRLDFFIMNRFHAKLRFHAETLKSVTFFHFARTAGAQNCVTSLSARAV